MKLRQVDVLLSQGMTMADAIHQIKGSEVTFYRWRKEYNTVRPISALGYRPATPETIIPLPPRPSMH